MAVLSVGPGKLYPTIGAAVTAAQNGDTVEVQAGTYTNQYVSINKNITLQGVGGMVSMVSTGLIPNGKAIFHYQRQHCNQQLRVFRCPGVRSQRRRNSL